MVISDCYEKINTSPVGEVWCKNPQRTKVLKNNNKPLLNITVLIEHFLDVSHSSNYFTRGNSFKSNNNSRGSAINFVLQMRKQKHKEVSVTYSGSYCS